MSYYEDGAIDQFKLPTAYAVAQKGVVVVMAKDFEVWAMARRLLCGHAEPERSCRVCQGTLDVNDAISFGSDGVRVFPKE